MNKEDIRNHYKQSGKYSATAKAFGVSRQRVHQIVTGYSSYKRKGDWWFNDPAIDWSKSDQEVALLTGRKPECVRIARRRMASGNMVFMTFEAHVSLCIGEVSMALKRFPKDIQKQAISILKEVSHDC